MLEHEAYKLFMAKAKGAVDEQDFCYALQATVMHIQGHISGNFNKSYTETVPGALEFLMDWYEKGMECRLDHTDLKDLCMFVVARCPGYIWAVLLRRLHESGAP